MARILVVDDVKFISRLLADLLGRQDHHVRIAGDGIEAIEAALADPPDLILLDITLPRLNGLDVARTLKTDPATSGVPIMMITSRRDETAVRAAIAAGVDDFLTKPFDDAQLLKRVKKLLAKYAPAARADSDDCVTDGVAILAPLPGDPETAWADELLRALKGSEPSVRRAVVVDLSHLESIGPEMADVIVAVREGAALAEEGGSLVSRMGVIRPGGCDLRTRLALARIARAVTVHDDREAALAAARSSGPVSGVD